MPQSVKEFFSDISYKADRVEDELADNPNIDIQQLADYDEDELEDIFDDMVKACFRMYRKNQPKRSGVGASTDAENIYKRLSKKFHSHKIGHGTEFVDISTSPSGTKYFYDKDDVKNNLIQRAYSINFLADKAWRNKTEKLRALPSDYYTGGSKKKHVVVHPKDLETNDDIDKILQKVNVKIKKRKV